MKSQIILFLFILFLLVSCNNDIKKVEVEIIEKVDVNNVSFFNASKLPETNESVQIEINKEILNTTSEDKKSEEAKEIITAPTQNISIHREKYDETFILTRGGMFEDPIKEVTINQDMYNIHFLGCVDFQEDQCGLRINNKPQGRIAKGSVISLNDHTILEINDLKPILCNEKFCDIDFQAYSEIIIQVTG